MPGSIPEGFLEIAGSADALATDDVAHAVVEPLDPLQVLFVSVGNAYLEAALAVHPNANVEAIAPAEFASRDDEALAAYDVLVLDRTPFPENRSHPSVLLFSPRNGQLAPSAQAEDPHVSAILASHPALRGVRMDGIRIGHATRFATEAGDQVLIRLTKTPEGLNHEVLADVRFVPRVGGALPDEEGRPPRAVQNG